MKGENVSFEPVLAGECWLTLMQNRRGEKKKGKRGRLARKAERERCGMKIEETERNPRKKMRERRLKGNERKPLYTVL